MFWISISLFWLHNPYPHNRKKKEEEEEGEEGEKKGRGRGRGEGGELRRRDDVGGRVLGMNYLMSIDLSLNLDFHANVLYFQENLISLIFSLVKFKF